MATEPTDVRGPAGVATSRLVADLDSVADAGRDGHLVGREHTRWVDAGAEQPEHMRRWLNLYVDTVEWVGGSTPGVRERVRLEVSVDGRPRELRFSPDGETWQAQIVLWREAHPSLWFQEQAVAECIASAAATPTLHSPKESATTTWTSPPGSTTPGQGLLSQPMTQTSPTP